MKSKVFIVCEPTHRIGGERISSVDLTPAAEWGEPVILLQSNQSLIDLTPTIELLSEKLKDYCDKDYIVPIGDPTLMCAVAVVAASKNGGRIALLKWDRLLKKYFPIRVNIQG